MQVCSKNTLMVGALTTLALMSQVAWAGEAAKVLAVTGSVYALDASGQKRPLDRKASVNEGDTIVSEADSTAQLRFVDGAVMGIKPSTQFKVDSYKVNANPETGGSSNISVAKGGFWTLTGSIGKQDPESYKVKTNYATIGVRGTAWDLHVGKAKEFMGVYQDSREHSKTGLHIASCQRASLTEPCKPGPTIDIGPDQEFSFASVDSKGNVQGYTSRPSELAGTAAGGAAGAGGKTAGAGAGGDGNAILFVNAGAAAGAGVDANGNNLNVNFFNQTDNLNAQGFLTAAEIASLNTVGVAASIGFPGNKTIRGLTNGTHVGLQVSGVGIDGFNPLTTTRVVRVGGTLTGVTTATIGGQGTEFVTFTPSADSPLEFFNDRNNPQTFVSITDNVYWATVLPMQNAPLAGTISFNSGPNTTIGAAYSGAITGVNTSTFNYNVTNGTFVGTADWGINTPTGLWVIDLATTPAVVTDNGFEFTSFGPGSLIDGAFLTPSGTVSGILTGTGPGQRGVLLSGQVFDPNNPARFISVVQGYNCTAGFCP